MTAEHENPLPPPAFDEKDKMPAMPAEPPQAPQVEAVAEPIAASAEATLPNAPDTKQAKAESTEDEGEALTFDALTQLDKKNLKILLGKVSPAALATSLAQLDTEAQDRVLSALSKPVATAIRAEVGKLGTVTDEAVEEAQSEIVEMAESLDEQSIISLDSLFEEEESVDQSSARLSPPSAPQTVEQVKTPAEALGDYFKQVESGTDFLQRIVNMPDDNGLRKSFKLKKLERLSGELSQKVIDFFELIETWEKGETSRREMAMSEEEFIASHNIPSGCQTAFRTIALFAINKILGPVADTPRASQEATSSAPPTPPSPSPAAGSGEAGRGSEFPYRQLSARELAESQRRKEAAEHAAKTGAVSGESSPQAAPASDKEAESFLERVKARARLGNPPRENVSQALPAVSPGVKEASAPPAAEAAEEVQEKAVEIEAAAGLTPEKIRALTFENLADLSDDELRAVVRASRTTDFGWGLALRGTSDAFSSRVRGLVDSATDFDKGFKWQLDAHETAEYLKAEREHVVDTAKEKLLLDILSSPFS